MFNSVTVVLIVNKKLPPPSNTLAFNEIPSSWHHFLACGLTGILLTILMAKITVKISDRASIVLSKLGCVSLHIMAQHFYFLIFVFQIVVTVIGPYTKGSLYDSYFWNFAVFIIATPICYLTSNLIQRYIFNKLPKWI